MRNRYLQSVTEAGGIPVVLPLSVSWDDVSWLLGRVDGFLIMGATDLLARVLGKNPATTSVIIEDVPPENWGIGGLNTQERRKREAGKRKRPEARSICAGFPRFFAKRWRSPVEKLWQRQLPRTEVRGLATSLG